MSATTIDLPAAIAPELPGRALQLNAVDRAALSAAGATLATRAVRVTEATDYPSLPSAGEISWPWSDRVRWLVWRDAGGVWLDELDTQELTGPGTMGEVLATAAAVLEAEARAFAAPVSPD